MKVLLLNQCFWPDLVATAQQLTEAARGLSERGHEVTVICSRRGYDDPRLRFPSRERWNEIEVIRIPSISLGKTSRFKRTLNFGSFYVTCAFRLALTRRQDVVVALTSPPLISWLASMFTRIKGGRLILWVMDLNPDEAIAAGWLKPNSVAAKVLSALLESSMRRAEKIVLLDQFMKKRVVAKGIAEQKIVVISPFSDASVHFDREGREAFRRRHNFDGKFVVMHAGNHSPCHPLDTLLESAKRLKDRKDTVFCFVGGGSQLSKVKQYARTHEIENICCLPYQPQAELSALLSAADLHVVVMGDAFPGIVHPSKVYNILATARPFLYIGPSQSHMGEIIGSLSANGFAMQALHGEVDTVVQHILNCSEKLDARLPADSRIQVQEFSRNKLLPLLIGELEHVAAELLSDEAPPSTQLQSVQGADIR